VPRHETVEDYVAVCTEEQRALLVPLLEHMRTAHPGWKEQLSYQIPTFRRGKQYVAFSVAKEHLSFHTLDFELVARAQEVVPRASLGKGSVKVRYDDPALLPGLTALSDEVVERALGTET
jgi:uncharacterized protein YdhG (YjbR/CyaY superfamily)